MMEILSPPQVASLIGLIGGIVLGLAARIGRFCTLGAIEDALYGQSFSRLGMWGLAIGVAITGTHLAMFTGLFDPSSTAYFTAPFSPIAAIVGGLAFGYGMALCGNCGYGALARLGGGDMRSFVIVLVMGISALMALSGPFALARRDFIEATSVIVDNHSFPQILSGSFGLSAAPIGIVFGLLIIIATLVNRDIRSNAKSITWGVVIGLTVSGTWVAMHWLSLESFEEIGVAGHTFSAPIGQSIIFLMTSSGGGTGFAVGSVFGVLIGALVGSLFLGHFRWEACEDPRELRRQIIGATIMGVGAALSLGCSIGQGLTAMSTMVVSGPIVLVSILAGAAFGLRQIMYGFSRLG